MSMYGACVMRSGPARVARLAAITCLLVWSSDARAQFNNNGFVSRAVGGISIDADGVLTNAELDNLNLLRKMRLEVWRQVPGDLNQPNPLRKVSLRRLEAALSEYAKTKTPLPDEVRYLAGLQRIQYVFVYPEDNDIVLVGFGEGWVVDERGGVVGASTGRPVLLLDDLLVALRTANAAAQGGITCSIDPTAEGLQSLQSFVKTLKAGADQAQGVIKQIETIMGPQTITVTGVPASSHFARVLVAADYRMKRLAMNFEPAPVAGLPSYLHMMKGKGSARGMQNMLPRWWLATNYDPMLTDVEGMSWELRGPGVKAMTEDDFLAADGSRTQSGKASPLAQKWADNMTAKYDELSVKDTIFGELRNCMDLAIIAALLVKENLPAKAGYSMPLLLNSDELPTDEFLAPKQVDTRGSFVATRNNVVISASGGVMLHSWGVADKKEVSDTLKPLRAAAIESQSKNWWWN